MRKRANLGPATLEEIFTGLSAGGFEFEFRDETVAKAALKQSLTKNTAIFHRLPAGRYGLASWYPGIKSDEEGAKGKPRAAAKKKHPKPSVTATRSTVQAKPEKPAKDEPHQETGASKVPPQLTLQNAVGLGIDAMPLEFTKQDVLDWVQKHHPDLNARKDSVFVMVTRLREKKRFTTLREGKGQEPSTFKKELASANGSHK